jgi:hypothetical protein
MDYRLEQKVIATITIEDKLQDFTELDVLENGVILGQSILFDKGILSMIGIGALDGVPYYDFSELKESGFDANTIKGLFIYFKNSNEATKAPWMHKTINYKVTGTKPVEKPDRFISNGEVY